MNYTFSSDGTLQSFHTLETGSVMGFIAKDVRRERTGLHALVGVIRDRNILASDVFNVGRNEDRGRLAKAAHAMLGADVGALYSATAIRHDLDLFCLGLAKAWEERFTVEEIHGDHDLGPVRYTLEPYILEEGGTIVFAPPKQGKSYVTLLMAQSINQGVTKLWRCHKRTVTVVNLERPAVSMRRRMTGINRALGLPLNTPLTFLNARGQSLKDVAGTIRKARREGKADVGFLDSISRAGFGTLVEDENANSIMDLMNGLFPCWFAIGHTPRASADHLYGSQMFDAASDVGVKLASEVRDNELGVRLEMVQANDVRMARPEFLRLRFDELGLCDAERATAADYPMLYTAGGKDRTQLLVDFVYENGGRTTTTAAAEATGIPRPNVNEIFRHSGRFEFIRKEGREAYYTVKSQQVTAEPEPTPAVHTNGLPF